MTSACAGRAAGGRIYVPGVGPSRAAAAAGAGTMVSGARSGAPRAARPPRLGAEPLQAPSLAVGTARGFGRAGGGGVTPSGSVTGAREGNTAAAAAPAISHRHGSTARALFPSLQHFHWEVERAAALSAV